MSNTAPDSDAVANGRMSNAVSGLCKKREVCCYAGIARYRRVAGDCAKGQSSIPGAHIGHFVDTVDVHEHSAMSKAHIHQWDETLASRQHLSFIGMFSQEC